MNTNEEIRA